MPESNWDTAARPTFGQDPEGQFVCRKCTISFEVEEEHRKGSHIATCQECGLIFRDYIRKDQSIAPRINLETYIKEGGELYNQGKCEVCGVALLGYNRVPRKRCGEHK